MGHFVYVSHRDTIEALSAAKLLIEKGHYPFVPQLNRLIHGRTDAEWENYFKMWLFRCDAIFLCASHREHELEWARQNHIPSFTNVKDLEEYNFPEFKELGHKFGEKCVEQLDPNEAWRKIQKDEMIKNFENMVGICRDPVAVGTMALMAWDRKTNG